MEKILEVKNVYKIYKAGNLETYALNNVSLCGEKGEFIVLSGPSGSGKTTLLNLIGSLDKPSKGEIIIDGENIATKSRFALSKFRLLKLGFIFQSYNLFPVLTAYENVAMPLQMQGIASKEVKERVINALSDVGLKDLANRKPNQLSGGQQQRVAVARALVSNPSIVLGDEPTANLDGTTAENLIELMKNMKTKYNTTFVVSSHDTRVIKHAERIIKLEDGKIINN